MTTLHHLSTFAQAVGITAGAYFAIAYPAWRITYNRRTRARYGKANP